MQRGLTRAAVTAVVAFAVSTWTTPPAHAQLPAQNPADDGRVDGPTPRRPVLEAGLLVSEISLDGRLDERAWAAARPYSGFLQSVPVEGVPAEEDTEVRVIVGPDAVYVGARMFESEPSLIDRRLVRRDEEGTYDYISVSLDANHDLRTGYYFRVTAANVQVDQYFFNDGDRDRAWDGVWESAVHHDDLGWTAEIRIPLSQIRYESKEDLQTWGINFSRKRMSSNETSYFSLRSRTREGYVSQFGRLEGVRARGGSSRVEVRPYVVSSMHRGPSQAGDPFFDGSEADARVGTDVRLGLGSAFTLDATINPDFGQVEADPAVINLSDFETRFVERRPFFVEDAQVFDFSLARSERGGDLYYSRRIGRAPQGSAPSGADFSQSPDNATILGAAKLTGKTASGLSLGVLAAVTDAERGSAYFGDDARFESFAAEPKSRFGVFRLQQDFNGGASQIGGIATAMSRGLPEDGTFDHLASEAYSGGIKLEHQWNDREWALEAAFAGTHVRGDSTALIRIQRSSNHYFQRPDATRFAVDSTATSLSGARWHVQLSRQNGRHWTGSAWVGDEGPSLEVNDLGFSRSREKVESGLRVGYREIQPGTWYKSYNVGMWIASTWSHEALDEAFSWSSWEGARKTGTVNANFRTTLLNEWGGDVNLSYSMDHRNFALTRGGPVTEDPGSWNVRGNVHSDARKAVSFKGGFNSRNGRNHSGDQLTVNGGVNVRPSSGLEFSLAPSFSHQTTAQQYVSATSTLTYDPTYGTRYLFGDLERRTVSMDTRVNWTFSPSLSLQLYAQTLLSSGDYLRYKQLRAPRTYDFDTFDEGGYTLDGDVVMCSAGTICAEAGADGDRTQHVDFDGDGRADYSFSDRDFNVRSLVGNAVLRWEYRPGSTVFFVWQRRQAGQVAMGDFDFDRDLGALWDAPSDDRLLIKVNYWLGI